VGIRKSVLVVKALNKKVEGSNSSGSSGIYNCHHHQSHHRQVCSCAFEVFKQRRRGESCADIGAKHDGSTDCGAGAT